MMQYKELVKRIDEVFFSKRIYGLMDEVDDRPISKHIETELSDIDIRLVRLRFLWMYKEHLRNHFDNDTPELVKDIESGKSIESMYKSLGKREKYTYLFIICSSLGLFWQWQELVSVADDKFPDYVSIKHYQETNNTIIIDGKIYWFSGEGFLRYRDSDNIPHTEDFWAGLNYPSDLDIHTLEDWMDYLYGAFIDESLRIYEELH